MEEKTEEQKRVEEITLWEDKKRHFGLPLSFTSYKLTNERIFRKSGFLVTHIEQTMYYRVQDIQVTRTLGQWFFGVGTVSVISTDKSLPDMKLENIRNPVEVKEIIHRNVEDVRAKMGIKPNEFMK